MKTLAFAVMSLLFVASSYAQEKKDDSLAKSMKPMFYKKRTLPIFNIALVYYGDYYTEADLTRVQLLLEKRFHLATDKSLTLKTVFKRVIPFKHQLIDYPDYKQDYVTDPVRLQRLWYYDHVGVKVLQEVYDQVKGSMEDVDMLAIVSGAQFDALGFASGRVAITENPMEIAWGLPDGGRVDYITDARVVDELIHEVGHTMFLDHAAGHCFKQGMTYQQSMECCETSEAKNDVMSYCRQRKNVNDNFFYGFEKCNLGIIKNKVIPAMLQGKAWNIADRPRCI